MVGQTVSHYRLTAELGAGGMGVVYRAEDLRLGRQVAIKFLPLSAASDRIALERFRREARAASALNHRHICTIYEIDEHAGRPFIVMEALDGETLETRISQKRASSLDRVLDVMAQVAEGLEAAHTKGVVHRDIKPSNIFVTTAGEVKLLDFGLAKVVASGREPVGLLDTTVTSSGDVVTRAGETPGTISYMSPEQVRGEELDARTDIFSCGIVMYEMATGVRPFRGGTVGLVLEGILHKRPPPASSLNHAIPAELDRILDKALEKDRELRYQSARELRTDLTRLRRSTGSAGAHDAHDRPPALARRPIAVVVASLGLVALASAGYFAWRGRAPAAPDSTPPALSRITTDDGLQAQPTWSPDGRFVAYTSDQGGNFDIWVQPLAGGRAVQVTTDPAADWQPAWSPDGSTLAFRSEREGGGIFVAPAFGGHEERLTTFGYLPQWMPDGSELLFVVRPMHPVTSVVPALYRLAQYDPRPRRILEGVLATFVNVGPIALHPDGKRITFSGQTATDGGIWAVPLSGGAAARVGISPSVVKNMFEHQFVPLTFRWAPSGDAVYVEGGARSVINLWRIGVDRSTLEWVSGPERLTTGIGPDREVAPSPDGSKLAFVARAETVRAWALPFDAVDRRVTGDGQPVSRASENAGFDLSADGRWLVSIIARPGKEMMELWMRSLETGAEARIGEAPSYFAPRLSRDAALVAYRALIRPREPAFPPVPDFRVTWMPRDGGAAHTMPPNFRNPFDWSPDGTQILHTCPDPKAQPSICVSPRDATSRADTRTVVADANYKLYQGRFSPDGRWITFLAQSLTDVDRSVLGVVRAAGGKWTALTAGQMWLDKPRWGPDGRTIYFISNRDSGFFDVWGLPFDPVSGKAAGEEFRVTRTEGPGRTISGAPASELGVSRKWLVVPLVESKGNVWLLDGISR